LGASATGLADRAERTLGNVEAAFAVADARLQVADGAGQGVGSLAVGAEDVEGQAWSRLGADARQPRKLLDQVLQGLGQLRHGPLTEQAGREAEAGRYGLHALRGDLTRLVERLVERRHYQVLEHLGVGGEVRIDG